MKKRSWPHVVCTVLFCMLIIGIYVWMCKYMRMCKFFCMCAHMSICVRDNRLACVLYHAHTSYSPCFFPLEPVTTGARILRWRWVTQGPRAGSHWANRPITHSITNSLTHSLTHPPTHSLSTHWSTHSLTTHTFTLHPLINSLTPGELYEHLTDSDAGKYTERDAANTTPWCSRWSRSRIDVCV